MRHLNNGTDHRHSKSCCDQSSPARRTMTISNFLSLRSSTPCVFMDFTITDHPYIYLYPIIHPYCKLQAWCIVYVVIKHFLFIWNTENDSTWGGGCFIIHVEKCVACTRVAIPVTTETPTSHQPSSSKCVFISLWWRHNECNGVWNHQPHDCLLNRLFRCWSKKTSKLRVTGLCEGNSPVTSEFPAQKASNAENVSIWWRHHVIKSYAVWLIIEP